MDVVIRTVLLPYKTLLWTRIEICESFNQLYTNFLKAFNINT